MSATQTKPLAWPWDPKQCLGPPGPRAKLCLVWPGWPSKSNTIYAAPSGVAAGDYGAPHGWTATRLGPVVAGGAAHGAFPQRLWKRGLDALSGATGFTLMYLLSPGSGQVAWENIVWLGRLDGSHVSLKLQVGGTVNTLASTFETASGTNSIAATGALTQDAWYWAVVRWQSGSAGRIDLYNLDGSAGPAAGVGSSVTSTLLADALQYQRFAGGSHRHAVGYVFSSKLSDGEVASVIDDPWGFLRQAIADEVEYVEGAPPPTETQRFYYKVAAPAGPWDYPGGTQPVWGTGWGYTYTLAQDGEWQGYGLVRDRACDAADPDFWYCHIVTKPGHTSGKTYGRFIFQTEPLVGAGTIGGTIKGRMRFMEYTTAANFNPTLALRVVSNDGQTIRGTLLAPTGGTQTNDTAPEANAGSDVSATYRNRQFPYGGAVTLTPVDYVDGDRIQVEIGGKFMVVDTPGGNYAAGVAFCEWFYGDNLDLPEDDTTGAASHEYIPWLELTTYDALAFESDAQHGTPLPNRLVTFTSDNHAVLADPPSGYTNDAGEVTTPALSVLAPGTAHVQATCETKVSNIATVTATSPAAPVASITVTPTDPACYVGDEVLLTAVCWDGPNGTGNILTGRNPGWSIDDATLAHWASPGTGDTLLVAADKAGTAHIRAWVGGIGSNTANLGISAISGPTVGRIVLSPATLAGQVGGQGTVQATVYSTGATLAEKRAGLLAYLIGLPTGSADRLLTGQNAYAAQGPGTSHLAQVNDIITQTGKAPALLGVALDWYARLPGEYGAGDAEAVAIAWGNAGGIVNSSIWPKNPQTGGQPSDTNIVFSNLLVPGHATRTAWFAKLDAIAATLTTIKNAGHVVLFRPFVELNGNWFWWGCPSHATQADFIAVWQEMWHYFMETKGLADCLLWNYNVNVWQGDYLTGYPGDSYVDVVSMDGYTDAIATDFLTAYTPLQTKAKPIFICEYGIHNSDWQTIQAFTGSNAPLVAAIKASLPNVFGFMVWDGNWAISKQNGAVATMTDPWCITRDELPSMGEQILNDRVVSFTSSAPTVASV